MKLILSSQDMCRDPKLAAALAKAGASAEAGTSPLVSKTVCDHFMPLD